MPKKRADKEAETGLEAYKTMTEKPKKTTITITYKKCGHSIKIERGGKMPLKCPECGE